MKIYLIRHGETAWNRSGRYLGNTDLPLSAEGRAQLKTALFSPGTVYVSPLRRCAETAELLFPAARLVSVEGLQEMNFGRFEGRSADEMEQDRAYRAWVAGGCEGRCPGGETKAEYAARVRAAFWPLLARARRERAEELVLVAHGGTQMVLLEELGRPRRPYWQWRTGNGRGFLLLDRGEWLELAGLWDGTGGTG